MYGVCMSIYVRETECAVGNGESVFGAVVGTDAHGRHRPLAAMIVPTVGL